MQQLVITPEEARRIDKLASSSYDLLTEKEKKILINYFKKNGSQLSDLDLYLKMKGSIYKNGKEPPTPKQFLDPKEGWLTKRYVDDLFDHVKQDFVDSLEFTRTYEQERKTRNTRYENEGDICEIVQYGCTRQGKSYMARLLMQYSIVFFHHLRDPQGFFSVGQDTELKIFIISFNYKKAKEVYLAPLYANFQKSDRFKQVTRQDRVAEMQDKLGQDYIVYSKASTSGSHITLASGLQIMSGNNDALSFIGSDMLQMYVSEIGFFIENDGATEEDIFRLYTDSVERIHATVGTQFLSFAYLDSSANDAESQLENYITNNLKKQRNVFFRQRRRWDIREYLEGAKVQFPIYAKTGETFQVCTGNGQFPPKILDPNMDNRAIPKHLIVDVPIDAKSKFTKNLRKSIKDIIGYPTSVESKFIQTREILEDLFDNPSIQNFPHAVVADVSDTTPDLIWNQVKDTFFFPYDGQNYMLRRAPREPRFVGFDLAFSSKGDIIGFCMLHREWSRKMDTSVIVIDCAFGIAPGKSGINLDQFLMFLKALVQKGRVYVKGSAVDSFQSEYFIQQLNLIGFPVEKNSNGKDIATYNTLISHMMGRTIKAGKNIFLQNNLDSLYRVKDKTKKVERIDHNTGTSSIEFNGDWAMSDCGKYHDDVAVALIQALHMCQNYEYQPGTVYEDQNEKFGYLGKKETPQQFGSENAFFSHIYAGTTGRKMQSNIPSGLQNLVRRPN